MSKLLCWCGRECLSCDDVCRIHKKERTKLQKEINDHLSDYMYCHCCDEFISLTEASYKCSCGAVVCQNCWTPKEICEFCAENIEMEDAK